MKKIVLVIMLAVLLVCTVGCNYISRDLIFTDKRGIAILFMDVWKKFPWDDSNISALAEQEHITYERSEFLIHEWQRWWNDEVLVNVQEKILPLLEFARKEKICIVFSRNGMDLLNDLQNLEYREPIINLSQDLDAYLKGKNIKSIYYAGYSTNNCVWGNSAGIKEMAKLGYKTTLIKDASLPANYQVLSYDEVLKLIDDVGDITTLKEFKEYFD